MLKERIIEKATILFLQKGLRAVSMDELAEENGISKRTIYENFKDKEELVGNVIIKLKKDIYDDAKEKSANSKNVLELFLHIIDNNKKNPFGKIRFYEDVKKYYPLIFSNFQNDYFEHHSHIKKFLLLGIKQGVFREKINIEIVAHLFLDNFYIIKRRSLWLTNDFSEEDLFITLAINLTRGISTQKGTKIIDNYLEKYNNQLKEI